MLLTPEDNHMTSPFTISCDHVLLPDGSVQPATLTVDEGKIQTITPGIHSPSEHLSAQLLTPAFINAHTHLSMACFRGIDVNTSTKNNMIEDLFYHVESHLLPEDVAAFATLGAFESLLNGVGLVWDHYYFGHHLAKAISSTGLCAVVAPTLQDISGPGVVQLEQQLQATLDLNSTHWNTQGIWSSIGPHATDTVSDDLWHNIANLAQTHNLPIHSHVAQSIEEFERSITLHNMSPITRLHSLGVLDSAPHILLVHAIFTSKDDMNLLSPNIHTLGYCPFSQLIFALPAHVHRWQEHQLQWIVATDAAASNDSMNLQKEMRFISGLRTLPATHSRAYNQFYHSSSLRDAKLTQHTRQASHQSLAKFSDPDFLLSRVFQRPGMMHPQFEAGVIKEGALANLIAWDLNHPTMWPPSLPKRAVAMNDSSQAIANVMTLGKWRGTHHNYHQSILASDLYKDTLQEANSRLTSLLQRAGI